MVKQFLPILFPSWRFFSGIGPSPRVELGFVVGRDESPDYWVAFRPLPQRLTTVQHIVRLFHNPHWNELLFINTCAERLFEAMDEFYMDEIAHRLLAAIQRGEMSIPDKQRYLIFRIRAIYSEAAPVNVMGNIRDEIFVQSRPYQLEPQGVDE
ncbi:MAG: hypothetical protein B0W54_22470 [Cellvibrio sp. 79]|nr:MAG: hypothetical protein B0W54_22470 [Cellvibrio sp. 79]